MITVLLRYKHTSTTEATHYRDDEGVLTVHLGKHEIVRFPTGSLNGVNKHESTQVREKDGRERPTQRREAHVSNAS